MTDLRSDTVTKPSPAMLEAMMSAEVGDDVFGEDPSINKLEALAAEMFGMESAIFCASGTMANQIGIKCHTQQGDEIICETNSHVYIYEGGGIAFNSGCQVKPINGFRGLLEAKQISEAINSDDIHKAHTRLVSLENTSNRGGGSCYDFNEFLLIKEECKKNNLALHLDGARIWNALVAKNEDPQLYGSTFDSISVCLSKGLGAPVGSLLLGKSDFIKKARRVRKVFGGGMRQAGYLAAAGIYALQNNIERLESDHHNAKRIATELTLKAFVGSILPVETNIIIFEVKDSYTPSSFCEHLKSKNFFCLAISSTQVRIVTHLDVSDEETNRLCKLIHSM